MPSLFVFIKIKRILLKISIINLILVMNLKQKSHFSSRDLLILQASGAIYKNRYMKSTQRQNL